MSRRGGFTARRSWALAAAVLAALLPVSASAQLVGNPAGPRKGIIYELALAQPDRATLARLNDLGFNIDHVTAESAFIYATRGEYDYLLANGYPVTLVSTQPTADAFPRGAGRGPLGTYHDYAGVTSMLQSFHANYPAVTSLVSIGKSVENRDIWAFLISNNPGVQSNEPEFKFVSTMHGDEPTGTEMCLYFIDHLLSNYGVDSEITSLVNGTAIWIVPLMNPDGLEHDTRYNANGIDLNRAFPEYPSDYSLTIFNGSPNTAGREPEVQALMNWSANHTFVLSANFHTGAVVASYPYDADPPTPTYSPALTPDHPLFLKIAMDYATNNPPMYANNTSPFFHGTVNGNDWYIVQGGMQDFMYRFLGDFDITIELSIPKRPTQSTLPDYWDDNRDSMMEYLRWAHRGVRGLVTDADTLEPVFAQVKVVGNSQPAFSDPQVGDYSRILIPGIYDLEFSATFYETQVIEDIVVSAGDSPTLLNVQLSRLTDLPGLDASALGAVALILAFLGARRLSRPA